MGRPTLSYQYEHTSRHGQNWPRRHPQTSAGRAAFGTRRHVEMESAGEHLTLRPVRGTGPLSKEQGFGYFEPESPCLPAPPMSYWSESGRNATSPTSARAPARAPSRARQEPGKSPVKDHESLLRYLGPGPVFYGDHVHHRASLELFVQFDKSTAAVERIAWRKLRHADADAGQTPH